MQARLVLLGVVALAVSGNAARTSSAATPGSSLPTLLIGPGHTFKVRPVGISLAVTGQTFVAGVTGTAARGVPFTVAYGKIVWRSWSRTEATGRGAEWQDNCTPDCARGRFRPDGPLAIVASTPHGGRFTVLTLRHVKTGKVERLHLRQLGTSSPPFFQWL